MSHKGQEVMATSLAKIMNDPRYMHADEMYELLKEYPVRQTVGFQRAEWVAKREALLAKIDGEKP